MGWGSAGFTIFDPVAQSLVDAGASDEVMTSVLNKLIGELQRNDWDTEEESLEKFRLVPGIVAAFRENGVMIKCGETGPEGDCARRLGHDGDHVDEEDHSWTRAVKDAA